MPGAGRPRKLAGLALELSKALPSTRRNPRIQVVSPSLCQDVLQRLAPTLPAHYGCDLVDVNPGACLWSQELHAALRPRRHILVEPERDVYDKFISPLLQDSRGIYRHTTDLKEAFDKEQGLLEEQSLQDEDKNFTRPNPTLVMTVNLTGKVMTRGEYSGSSANHFFNELFLSLQGMGSDLFRYGLIRILAWVSDDTKLSLLPRSAYRRTKQSFQFDACTRIQEVAGLPFNQNPDVLLRTRRWYNIDLENTLAVQAAEEAAGLVMPANRQDLPPLPQLINLDDVSTASLRNTKFHSDWNLIPEFLELDARVKKNDPKWHLKVTSKVKHTRRKVTDETADQTEWRHYVNRLRTRHQKFLKTVSLIERQRDLEKSWRTALLNDTVDESEDSNFKVQARRLRAAFAKESVDNQRQAKRAIDDIRTWDAIPKAMNWNLRTMEPLTVRPDEFHPQKPLALLDITPNPQYRQILDTDSKRICFEYFLTKLASYRARSIQDALQEVLGTEIGQFVKTVPSLQDVAKGGWYDLDSIRVRSLSAEIMLDLGLAYQRWPFRPDTQKLLAEMTKESDLLLDG